VSLTSFGLHPRHVRDFSDLVLTFDTSPSTGYAHCGTEVVIDTRGNCVIMPSVVERAFRPRRNALHEHFLDAYTTAFDALIKRHAHVGLAGQDDDDGGDGRASQLPSLQVQVNEDGDRQEQAAYDTDGAFGCAFPYNYHLAASQNSLGWMRV
jgi:hypothetical protein